MSRTKCRWEGVGVGEEPTKTDIIVVLVVTFDMDHGSWNSYDHF